MHDSRFHSKCVQFGELLLNNRHHNIIACQTESIKGIESIEECEHYVALALKCPSIDEIEHFTSRTLLSRSIVDPKH